MSSRRNVHGTPARCKAFQPGKNQPLRPLVPVGNFYEDEMDKSEEDAAVRIRETEKMLTEAFTQIIREAYGT